MKKDSILAQKALSAVRWTAASAIFRGLIQIVQLALLARLLLPEYFGLVATVAAIISLGTLFSDLGLNSAYLHARNIGADQRVCLYWLNILFSSILTILIILVSKPISQWYNDQRLEGLLATYSLVYIIIAIGQQLRIDAEKRLAFAKVACIEITSSLVAFGAAIFAATTGFGPFSIVFGALTSASVSTVLNWIMLSDGWRPSLQLRFDGLREQVVFGITLIANGLVAQLSTNLDMLLGGKLLGSDAFGVYAVPRNFLTQVLSLINPVITRVGFPIISHIQDDTSRVREVYCKAINAVVAINAPVYLGIAFFSEATSSVLFGDQWANAAAVFRILAIFALLRCIMNPLGSLLYGLGRPGLALKWNIAQVILAPFAIYSFSEYGAPGLAYAMVVLMTIQIFPAWYLLIYRVCGLSLLRYTRAIVVPVLLTTFSFAPACLLAKLVQNEFAQLFLAGVTFLPIYFLVNFALKQEWIILILGYFKIKSYSIFSKI